MTDEYATLRAAFHAGARIQAWHLICTTSNSNQGRWETLTPPEGREPEFGCAPHLYRIHPDDTAILATASEQAPVAVPSFRGYANLGVGAYLLEHSAEGEDAELVIVPATEAEKAGRTVGDLRHFEGERDPIPAERMAVRLRFDNVGGLDALEQQLRLLRQIHFPTSPAHTSEARDAKVAELLAAAKMANGDHVAPHDCYATGPLTGDPVMDLVVCPGCRLSNAIAAMRQEAE